MADQRLAVCIGINDYPGTSSDLSGCVNDARGWEQALQRRGFGVQVLLDAGATRAAMRDFIAALVSAVGYGDIAVVTFSGHGTWIPDVGGDEADRRDEALVPYDVMESGVLDDDELHDLFSQRRHGARIVMISDSCHSGTVSRFAPATLSDRPRTRFLAPGVFLDREQAQAARAVAALPPRGRSRPSALLMSGCADVEYSYDGYGPYPMGAFSAVALQTLERLPPGATYADWHRQIRTLLPAVDLPQTPQLTGTRTQKDWPIFEGIQPQAEVGTAVL